MAYEQQLADAEAEIARAWEEVGGKPDPNEDVDPEVSTLDGAIRVCIGYERDRAEQAYEEIKLRREALALFAKLAEAFDDFDSDDHEFQLIVVGQPHSMSIRLGDCRRARELSR